VKALRFKARLSAAWAGFNRVVEDYGTYASTFGYVRGASFFLARRRLANLGRQVELMIPGTDIPLTLRVGTSDVEVFREILHRTARSIQNRLQPFILPSSGRLPHRNPP
jgi:pimeloyl-ACP methyl ester carboxylesterase